MLRILFRKWWVLLLQGILLIVLSIYIFKHPVEVLAGLSFWFGVIVLAAGLLGILTWLIADKAERESLPFFWSVLTAVFGGLMLLHLTLTMKTLTVIFGVWILVTGTHLLQSGWSLKNRSSLGWVLVIAGAVSIGMALMIIFNIGTGAVGISMLLGIQVMLAGIALVLLALAKKMLANNVKDKIESLRQRV